MFRFIASLFTPDPRQDKPKEIIMDKETATAAKVIDRYVAEEASAKKESAEETYARLESQKQEVYQHYNRFLSELQPFSLSHTCPKCKKEKMHTEFKRGQKPYLSHNNYPFQKSQYWNPGNPEYLAITCNNCKYVFGTKTADEDNQESKYLV